MYIYCCFKHIELAFEEIIEEFEKAPLLGKIETKNKLSTTCKYCDLPATYVVSNECTHTEY